MAQWSRIRLQCRRSQFHSWLGRSPGEGIGYPFQCSWASLVAQTVENPPAMQETWVGFLGREDPLEKGMATHSSIPAWRIPWTEEPGGIQSMESQRVRHDRSDLARTHTNLSSPISDLIGICFCQNHPQVILLHSQEI